MALEPLLGLLHPNADAESVDVYDHPRSFSAAGGRIAVIAGRPLARMRYARRIRRRGLAVTKILLRGRPETRQVVSMDDAAIATAFREGGRALSRLLAPSLLRALASCTSRVALVVHARDVEPVQWLYAVGSAQRTGRHPFVLSLARGAGSAYAVRFDAHSPQAFAKVGFDDTAAERLQGEAVALRDVTARAPVDDVSVPALLGSGTVSAKPVVVQRYLAGETVAPLLGRRGELLDDVVGPLSTWLERWATSTAVPAEEAPSAMRANMLGALDQVAAVLDAPQLAWLRAQIHDALARPLTVVATHNDLTMWNVLRPDNGALAVIDWESADAQGLPLVDLFYGLADAVAATRRYASRAKAFDDCFHAGGLRADWARGFVRNYAQALGLSSAAIAFSFVACWLQHAADDASRGEDAGFVELLRELTDTPEMFWPLDGRS